MEMLLGIPLPERFRPEAELETSGYRSVYTSSDACLDTTSANAMCRVTSNLFGNIPRKYLSGSSRKSPNSLVPSWGMNLRHFVARFGG
nr:hypothetical protein Iba_chr07dCG2230 [Ipomoea batatas]